MSAHVVVTHKIAVSELKAGDRILPPEREMRLWMRRELATRELPESALVMTVIEVREMQPDKRGAWSIIKAQPSTSWSPLIWSIQARPATMWPIVMLEE